MIVEESIHVTFNEDILLPIESHEYEDNDTTIIEKNFEDLSLQEKQNQEQIEVINKNHNDLPKEWKYVGSHPKELILGDPSQGIKTRSTYREEIDYIAFVSQVEPHSLEETEIDPNWMMAMHEELNEFKRNNVWTLVNRPLDHPIIGTKWVFRNKLNKKGQVIRNKARLVAKGYYQEEGIDFDETYALIARLEAIRLLLAFACYMNFKLFQIDVKNIFLNGFISEEVYVEQPPGFLDQTLPNHVFKLNKALYGLKQAPRAWHDKLSNFLLENNFTRGNVDKTLFIQRKYNELLVV